MNPRVMRWLCGFGLAGLGCCAMPAGAADSGFEGMKTGAAPEGWTCGSTGGGTPSWTVEPESSAAGARRVLKQSGRGKFPWCVRNGPVFADGWVQVKFKALAGKEDQAGGVVWRWADTDHYYVARANALENNVSLYCTQGGTRRTIRYRDAPVQPNTWHLLRVEFKGSHIRVFLNGKLVIEEDDKRITGPGKLGVWTKADSVTVFDEFGAAAVN